MCIAVDDLSFHLTGETRPASAAAALVLID